MAVTAHSGSMGWHGRESINNFTYNHIGHFAAASHAFARRLIIGGVVKRFPALRFAMLEGGVGWACNLLTDLVGHWEKRNGRAMESQTCGPLNLERELLRELFTRYRRHSVYEDRMEELMAAAQPACRRSRPLEEMTERERDEQLDDFAAAGVSSTEELQGQFADHFYFGCEADDPTTAWAFDRARPSPPQPASSAPTWATST